MECPICLDMVENSKCETECGHIFHSQCMFKTIASGNFRCPTCRFELIKAPQNLPIELVDGSHVLSPGTVILRPVSIMRRGRVLTAMTQFERAQGNTSTPENNNRNPILNFFSCLF
jgi:hypothetical protein